MRVVNIVNNENEIVLLFTDTLKKLHLFFHISSIELKLIFKFINLFLQFHIFLQTLEGDNESRIFKVN